jgi:hypothetical protein
MDLNDFVDISIEATFFFGGCPQFCIVKIEETHAMCSKWFKRDWANGDNNNKNQKSGGFSEMTSKSQTKIIKQ